MLETIVIDDKDYFRAVDAKVREGMQEFEELLLPTAEQAIKDTKLKIEEFPIEGYYYKTEKLQKYFKIIKTLQERYSPKITNAIKKLHDIYTHPIFGLGQGKPTAINPNAGLPLEAPATISPVIDPVTLASLAIQPYWTINGIMNQLHDIKLGKCLVGLAILVDENNKNPNGSYNPLATCMACETTVLSRMKVTFRSAVREPIKQVEWKVSKNVEKYGTEVIDGYNDLFKRNEDLLGKEIKINCISPENVLRILDTAPSIMRCVNLNIDSTRKDGCYHWAIVYEAKDNKYAVKDFFANRIVTTKEYQEDTSIIKKFCKD